MFPNIYFCNWSYRISVLIPVVIENWIKRTISTVWINLSFHLKDTCLLRTWSVSQSGVCYRQFYCNYTIWRNELCFYQVTPYTFSQALEEGSVAQDRKIDIQISCPAAKLSLWYISFCFLIKFVSSSGHAVVCSSVYPWSVSNLGTFS